jgi:hypothetical protein
MYNILPTLTSLPKEVLLWARILLVALHMWCLPPSAVCRGMSATVTLIPGKLQVSSWLIYNRILQNVNTNHLKLSQMVYSNEAHTFSTRVLRYFACLTDLDVHLLQIQNLLLNFITDISLNSQWLFLMKFKHTPYQENVSTQSAELNEICIFKLSW